MNVPWYYASKGERFGPLAWEKIRQAVDEKSLGPDDLIWTPAFGKAWRKAETMTGLFPPPEPPPVSPPSASSEGEAGDAKTGSTAEIERAVEALLQKEVLKSPFASTDKTAEAVDQTDIAVNCRKALSQAWELTSRLVFETFSFRRWFFLSLCVMLMMLNPPNPFAGFMSTDADSPSTKQIDGLGLNDVANSGIFNLTMPLDEKSRKAFESEILDDWAPKIGAAMRETAVATQQWFANAEHRHHLLFGILGAIFVYGIGIWFSARGNAMFLARLYRPDAIIFSTWIEADKPAGALFRGMMVIRLISLSVFLLIMHHAIVSLAALPADVVVPVRMTTNIIRNLALIMIADRMIMGFIKDFVTPHVLLTTPKFFTAFLIAVQSTGVWFIRYLFLLSIAYLGIGTLVVLTGLVFGIGVQLASVLVFASPLFGALLTLPLHLIRRFWTLNIVFQLHPSLRMAVPRAKLIRIVK